jgi:hypothetical protein
MTLFVRTVSGCAKTFNILTITCLLAMIMGILFSVVHLNIAYLMPVGVLVACLIGIVFFQMGYSPIIAILVALSPSLPYVGTLALLTVLVIARYYLQGNNYIVGFTGARISSQNPVPFVPIHWTKCFVWFAVFFSVPFFLFVGCWVLNSEYMDKFFQPIGGTWWMGPSALLIAGMVSLLTFPLIIEIQRLKTIQTRTGSMTFQIILINLLAVVFCGISSAIVLLTPAVITMYGQMVR